ncbi:hypothetical protein F5X96DRAFT_649026 [Biscogniauxia mediterranea]|nr:hypothetical protein F5X96DRAFT_649026 [Biscogniauxia mediterranea]
MSYAEAAASGPKQTPEEAAAPQPPQLETSQSASTSSLVDVDTPSVRTVPSDFLEQEVQTETQANRLAQEDVAARARAEAELKKKKGSSKAKEAASFLTQWFSELSDNTTTALAVSNLAVVAGISVYTGYKALGLYERGRLTWNNIGIGAGIFLGLGLVESILGPYLYKAKKERQS